MAKEMCCACLFVEQMCIFVVVLSCVIETRYLSGHYSNSYRVKIRKGSEDIVRLEAELLSLTYYGKIASNIHLFVDTSLPERMKIPTVDGNMNRLQNILKDKITDVEQIILDPVTIHVRDHSPREEDNPILKTLQAQFPKSLPCYGMNVEQAWANNITGLGVTVAVVDNGVDMNHRDLKHNIKPHLSWNFFTNDSHVKPQRFPNYKERDEHTDHGNNIAGIIAAEKGNQICSSGVAYNASLAVLQTIQLPANPQYNDLGQNDLHIHSALSYKNDMIDIYSVSINNVKPYRKPRPEMTEALTVGTSEGRQGKGCIYVFSAGDDRDSVYDCNTDSYVSNVNTIAIGSVGVNGWRPEHALRCSCILTSTFWGTTSMQNTPFYTTSHDDRCSDGFSGSSASAALASGVIALLLQANPQLTWRDVQYLLVFTSTLAHLRDDINATTINAVGLKYHPYFGFGLMDASALAFHAQNWTNVPPRVTQAAVYMPKCEAELNEKTCDQRVFMAKTEFPHCDNETECISHLERVMVNVVYTTVVELATELVLRSPAGTLSKLKSRNRKHAQRRKHKKEYSWTFQSVQFWGENPHGEWKLYMLICSKIAKCYKGIGIHHMEITLFGVSTLPLSSHLRSWYSTNNTRKSAPSENYRQGEDTCSELVSPETSNNCDKSIKDDSTIFKSEDDLGFPVVPVVYYYIGTAFVFGFLGMVIWYCRTAFTPYINILIWYMFLFGLVGTLLFYFRILVRQPNGVF